MQLPKDWNEYDAAVLLLFIAACFGRESSEDGFLTPLTCSEAEVTRIFDTFNDLLNIGRLTQENSRTGLDVLEKSAERVQLFLHGQWDPSRNVLFDAIPDACVVTSRHFSRTDLTNLTLWLTQVGTAEGPPSQLQRLLPGMCATSWGLV